MSTLAPPDLGEKENITKIVESLNDGDIIHLQSEILEQLRQLKRITMANTLMTEDTKPTFQIVYNSIVQGMGLTLALLFGIFAILAWNAALKANELANVADLMALMAYCQSPPNDNDSLCSVVQVVAAHSVSALASSVYGITATATSSPAATSSSSPVPSSGSESPSKLSIGPIVGVAIGGLMALSALIAGIQTAFVTLRQTRVRAIKENAGVFPRDRSG